MSNKLKKYLITISLLLAPAFVGAVNVSDFTVNEVESAFLYNQAFDQLVLDVIIPSGTDNTDKLLAFTIKNDGIARDINDIKNFILWTDDGIIGFNGFGKDNKVDVLNYNSSSNYWYISNLNLSIPEEGLRIFVSADISINMTTNRSIKMRIPQLDDVNNNGEFDVGDFGIFLESKNNGPTDGTVRNSFTQTLKDFIRDNLAPRSVIDDPIIDQVLESNSYTISGQARDHGGSTPSWVKILINDVSYDVVSIGQNYSTWDYQWNNIEEGDYVIKTQSSDWLGNIEEEGDSIAVTVKFPITEEPEPIEEDADEVEEEVKIEDTPKNLTIQELKDIISKVQQQIIVLINQLIQIYMNQL